MIAPVLGLPIQDNYKLHVYEKGGLALGVVTQLWGITAQPVGYLSKELDQEPRDGKDVFKQSLQ
jgi:hypothetical protein